MATTDHRVQEIQSLLASCTPEHAAQIIQALQIAGSQAPNADSTMPAEKVTKTGAKQHSKKAKRENATGGPKRPLNSWMAFRKFYNASLAPHTQRTISKVLMTWWRDDPFEAKWAILAKAYSILRGNREKEDAPLDEYFHIAAPMIGVISPEEYPNMMGWQLTASSNGDQVPQITRRFVPDISQFPSEYTTTNRSVDDIVQYCRAFGFDSGSYLSGRLIQAAQNPQGALTMAVQPNTTTQPKTPCMTDVQTAAAELEQDIFEQFGATLGTEPAAPSGQVALNDAIVVVSEAGAYPYNNLFSPLNALDISFNPAEETDNLADGGKWDAFDLSVTNAYNDGLDFSFSQFVNDDGTI